MPEATTVAAALIVGAQLVLPLAIGLPPLVRDMRPAAGGAAAGGAAGGGAAGGRAGGAGGRAGGGGKRRKRGGGAAAAPEAVRAPALAPLRCAACAAPVPLLAASFPCPSCGAAVAPPPEYVRALERSRERDDALGRAERLWRLSRWVCSPLVVWGLRIGVVAWLFAVTWAIYVGHLAEIPKLALLLPALLALLQIFLGMAVASALADVRRILPPVPRRSELAVPAADASCEGCAGPTRFAADRLSATCGYCGGENYRAALSHALHAHADAGAKVAHASLSAQVAAAEERTEAYDGAPQMLAVGEIFYACVLLIGACGSLLSWL